MATSLDFSAHKNGAIYHWSLEDYPVRSEGTARMLLAQADLPQHIQTYIVQYEDGLTQAEYYDPRFSYRVAFLRKTSNAKTAADKVVEFVPAGSDTGVAINKVVLKETEKEVPSEHDREADEGREAGCLVFCAIANALLTSALLLQVRWDTPRFVVQILAQSRLSKA